MSFSYRVKTEICNSMPTTRCCSLAACYGILLYCHTFSPSEIRIVTGNESLATLLPKMFRRAFGFGFDSVTDNSGKSGKQTFLITDANRLTSIFSCYGYNKSGPLNHHVNLSVLEEDCCRLSFIKGAFLAGGSVTEPAKGYHLEFITGHSSVTRETRSLMLELGFQPGETSRKGGSVLYFKQSTVIEDFLTTIGAPIASMDVMAATIEKDVTNKVNRQVNCDTANVKKTVNASSSHIRAIHVLQASGTLEELPEKYRETAFLRLEYPEESISQLAERHVPPISKSCVNHRLRKILDAAGQSGRSKK